MSEFYQKKQLIDDPEELATIVFEKNLSNPKTYLSFKPISDAG